MLYHTRIYPMYGRAQAEAASTQLLASLAFSGAACTTIEQ